MRWPDSLWARLTLLLFGSLLIAQLLSATLHFQDRGQLLMHATGYSSAQRISAIVTLLDPMTPQQRQPIVRALDHRPLRVQLLDAPAPLPPQAEQHARAHFMHRLLHLELGQDRPIEVLFESTQPPGLRWDDDHDSHPPMHGRHGYGRGRMGNPGWSGMSYAVQTRLQDGQWIHFSYRLPQDLSAWPMDLLLALSLLFVVVLMISYWAVRWLIKPLSTLSHAAEQLGKDIDQPPLDTEGPREIRQAAHAFNTMQGRIQRFVEERTRMLSAVSHDLKTPITRMRLRLEQLPEGQLKQQFEQDLDDMQTLVQSSLDFMRGIATQEASQALDMNALLEALMDDLQDQGYRLSLHGRARQPYIGKALALKRCLSNLLDNAVRYGGETDIHIHDDDDQLCIHIIDHGPGLSDQERDKVFEPFYRVESSRNRHTGGTGLGLSIARNIARSHGGDITLHTPQTHSGLEVHLCLPR